MGDHLDSSVEYFSCASALEDAEGIETKPDSNNSDELCAHKVFTEKDMSVHDTEDTNILQDVITSPCEEVQGDSLPHLKVILERLEDVGDGTNNDMKSCADDEESLHLEMSASGSSCCSRDNSFRSGKPEDRSSEYASDSVILSNDISEPSKMACEEFSEKAGDNGTSLTDVIAELGVKNVSEDQGTSSLDGVKAEMTLGESGAANISMSQQSKGNEGGVIKRKRGRPKVVKKPEITNTKLENDDNLSSKVIGEITVIASDKSEQLSSVNTEVYITKEETTMSEHEEDQAAIGSVSDPNGRNCVEVVKKSRGRPPKGVKNITVAGRMRAKSLTTRGRASPGLTVGRRKSVGAILKEGETAMTHHERDRAASGTVSEIDMQNSVEVVKKSRGRPPKRTKNNMMAGRIRAKSLTEQAGVLPGSTVGGRKSVGAIHKGVRMIGGNNTASPGEKMLSPTRRESSRGHVPKKMDPNFVCTDSSHLKTPLALALKRSKEAMTSPTAASAVEKSPAVRGSPRKPHPKPMEEFLLQGIKKRKRSTGNKTLSPSPQRKCTSTVGSDNAEINARQGNINLPLKPEHEQSVVELALVENESGLSSPTKLSPGSLNTQGNNSLFSLDKGNTSGDCPFDILTLTPKKDSHKSLSPKSSSGSHTGDGILTPKKTSFIKNRKAISGCVTYNPKLDKAKKKKRREKEKSNKGSIIEVKKIRPMAGAEHKNVDIGKRKRKRKRNVFDVYGVDSKRRKILSPKRRISAKQEQAGTVPPTRRICKKCGNGGLVCCCRVSSRCSFDTGISTRWCHLSSQEHYCNSCFEHFYRPRKAGFEVMVQWREKYLKRSTNSPGIRDYMTDQILPYWVQCTVCMKWRKLAADQLLTPELVKAYTCEMTSLHETNSVIQCSTPEDPQVEQAKSPEFLQTLFTQTFFTHHPALPFLDKQPVNEAGISAHYAYVQSKRKRFSHTDDPNCSSASDNEDTEENGDDFYTFPTVPDCPEFLRPFTLDQGKSPSHALALNPGLMEKDETREFFHYSSVQPIYLGLRNLVLAMWCLNSKEVLSWRQCCPHLICRGLARIRCVEDLGHVVDYLTRRGLVNTGVLNNIPSSGLLPQAYNQGRVLVIGAGIAGLAAARHLANMGTKVTVLEAQSKAGGRIKDDSSCGMCVGKGAQTINGTINNPIRLICHQCDLPVESISNACDIIDKSGGLVKYELDKRVEVHFNSLLDKVAEWRKDKFVKDTSLLNKIKELHQQLPGISQIEFSKEADDMMQFHLGNIEYASGSCLDHLSAVSWDQNEDYPQFIGEHLLLTKGFSSVIDKLKAGLDVRVNTEVVSVDYSNNEISVLANNLASGENHEEFRADHVIVTLPVSLLQKQTIAFNPPLSKRKDRAIKAIGLGQLEKVILEFPVKFWAKNITAGHFFGCVPESEKTRGLFNLFCDMSPNSKTDAVLVSYICGSAVDLIQGKSEKQIQDMCLATLKKMFPDQEVPPPSRIVLTGWQREKYSSMAYSYLPVGASGRDYSVVSETVHEKLHFAGEATSRQFPQSVVGAYLSGIREARNIAASSYKSSRPTA